MVIGQKGQKAGNRLILYYFNEISLSEVPQYYMAYRNQTTMYNQVKKEKGFKALIN